MVSNKDSEEIKCPHTMYIICPFGQVLDKPFIEKHVKHCGIVKGPVLPITHI